jgi:hypothetical protein
MYPNQRRKGIYSYRFFRFACSNMKQQAKLTTLMITMKSMINDMQDFNYDCNARIFTKFGRGLFNEIWWWSENTHIAPNCKKIYDYL